MQGQKKIGFLEVADLSGGVNSIENAVRIGPTQVQPTTMGCILKRSGFVKYPGAIGLSATDTFADHLRWMALYRQFDTTETLCALSNGKLYFVNKTDGSLTEKYTLGSASNYGSSCESYNKLFLCNGTSKVVKVEGSAVYPVGIAPPTGVTAAASAGAGLPDGVYDVVVGYARRVSSADVLYSTGQVIGSITLGSGNNRITVSNFANSSDAQVGSKILWLKSPGEIVHYYFYGTNDNTTTSFTVSSTATKAASNIYETYALDNGLPPSGTFIYSFANRLWMIVSNLIYYSAKGYTQYDIERFPSANVIVTPYNITGIFSVGRNLYFNTESGIVEMESADPNAVLYLTEPRWHFSDMNTVDRWNNGVIGLTNDGVRFFDGTSFSNYDMSYNIKNYIDQAIKSKSNFRPCGYVYRRAIRNEYHLMWQDDSTNVLTNNMHATLNLDSLMYASAEQFNAAWEFQPHTGNYVAVSRNDNTVYVGQNHATAPKVYKENTADNLMNYMYGLDGVLITTATAYQLYFLSRIMLPAVNALCWMDKFRVLLKNNRRVIFTFLLPDQTQDGGGVSPEIPLDANFAGASVYGDAVYGVDYYPIENAYVSVNKFPENFSGREVMVMVAQKENDPDLQLWSIQMQYTFETGNFL